MVDTISYMSTVDAGDFSWEEAVVAAVVAAGVAAGAAAGAAVRT
jgi:hypothetical protein